MEQVEAAASAAVQEVERITTEEPDMEKEEVADTPSEKAESPSEKEEKVVTAKTVKEKVETKAKGKAEKHQAVKVERI